MSADGTTFCPARTLWDLLNFLLARITDGVRFVVTASAVTTNQNIPALVRANNFLRSTDAG
jgi:hypothetical protein